MRRRCYYSCVIIGFMLIASACTTGKKAFTPSRKYSADQLHSDFRLLREILEKFHPSLYWYTPKDSMDYYFDKYDAAITDSMTQQQFGFRILAPLTTRIRCGHTSFNYSKKYNRYMSGIQLPSFPLYMKIWGDTAVITANLIHDDSILKRGVLVTGINGFSNREIIDSLFQFMPADGYAENVNYIRLSAAFPYYHRNIFGLSRKYLVDYIDSLGRPASTIVPWYNPYIDTLQQIPLPKITEPGRKRLKKVSKENIRSLEIDSSHSLATMTLSSFSGKGRLGNFFRRSFKTLKKDSVPNLVIDIRTNGGGKITNYTKLARYIRDTPFKVSDTAAAVRKKFGHYRKNFQSSFVNSFVLLLFTRKEEDGRYHFRYWENHSFRPREKWHYNGKVYVLINGPTFSASTLFAHAVRGQDNVKLVGEEAGGGWHGNSGIMIPDIILPITRMRIRVPLFRIVQYKHVPKDGRGVEPDIYVPATVENIRKGIDGKMKAVEEMVEVDSRP
jgi:hypothetical protein